MNDKRTKLSQTAHFVKYNLVGQIGETIGKAQQAISLIEAQPSQTKSDRHNLAVYVALIGEEYQRAKEAKLVSNLERYFKVSR